MIEDDDAVDPISGRRLSDYHSCSGESILCLRPDWTQDDESHLDTPTLIERIWTRLNHAVAPNGHTCPFVTLEEWINIREWFRLRAPPDSPAKKLADEMRAGTAIFVSSLRTAPPSDEPPPPGAYPNDVIIKLKKEQSNGRRTRKPALHKKVT